MKFAYFVRPHLGGTYSVYVNLHAGLKQRGVEVQWVALDAADDRHADDRGAPGFFLDPRGFRSEKDQARALIDRLQAERFDGVFVNVLAERLQMNIVRHLPRQMLRVMIVHNITPATYAAAAAIRDHVHATVAVSERARRDLVARHGFSAGLTRTIRNAVDVRALAAVARPVPVRPGLRLLFLGRIEDISKGVFWLPRILERLSPGTTLTVAGDGPDLAALKQRLAPFGDRVACLGAVARERVPDLLAGHDALLMPSRYEGLPVTLLEAMAAGCVPVASHIAGVTDDVVTHGVSGLLFPVGDWRQAAREIAGLESDPWSLRMLSANARQQARMGFDLEQMAAAYRELIEELRARPPAIAAPLPLDRWSTPAGFRPGLRTLLPRPVKNWLRVARERVSASS